MIANVFHSERFVLRPFRLDDAAAVFEYASDPAFLQYLPIPMPYTRVHAEQFVAAQAALDRDVHPSWAIEIGGQPKGGLNIRFSAAHRLAEIGYGLAPALWNQGIATEAARLVVSAAFAAYPQLTRIQATADSRNHASVRVMEKVGFRREGLLRRQRVCRGELTDQIVCGALRDEWISSGDRERPASPPDILSGLPVRDGHFLLESGYHTDVWITLDALFVSPRENAPRVSALAARLRPHGATGICGSLLGGAFLAQALATELGVDFHFTEPVARRNDTPLFGAEYRLPPALQRRIRGQRVAIVDDVISAGSSVRATAAAAAAAGGTIVAVGALFVLGRVALDHFAGLTIPVESLGQREFALWEPSACPLCAAGVPLEDPVHAIGPV
jgi:RimJ/RimL family protein N-acetyltransferase/orotate phosphoribosyltransferase